MGISRVQLRIASCSVPLCADLIAEAKRTFTDLELKAEVHEDRVPAADSREHVRRMATVLQSAWSADKKSGLLLMRAAIVALPVLCDSQTNFQEGILIVSLGTGVNLRIHTSTNTSRDGEHAKTASAIAKAIALPVGFKRTWTGDNQSSRADRERIVRELGCRLSSLIPSIAPASGCFH